MSPCRTCGLGLEREKHRKVGYSSAMVNGSTQTSSWVYHVACPKCGDPKPTPWQLSDAHNKVEIIAAVTGVLFFLIVTFVLFAGRL